MTINGDQTPDIDRNRLRKANWMLGTNTFKYESISKSAFGTLNQTVKVSNLKEAIDEIKQRVRGDSVDTKTGSLDDATIKSYF